MMILLPRILTPGSSRQVRLLNRPDDGLPETTSPASPRGGFTHLSKSTAVRDSKGSILSPSSGRTALQALPCRELTWHTECLYPLGEAEDARRRKRSTVAGSSGKIALNHTAPFTTCTSPMQEKILKNLYSRWSSQIRQLVHHRNVIITKARRAPPKKFSHSPAVELAILPDT